MGMGIKPRPRGTLTPGKYNNKLINQNTSVYLFTKYKLVKNGKNAKTLEPVPSPPTLKFQEISYLIIQNNEI